MTWTITSRSESDRWLTHNGDTWQADPETTAILSEDGYAFPLTPTGPVVTITDDSTLMAAALNLLPGATVSGDHPDYPPFPSVLGFAY